MILKKNIKSKKNIWGQKRTTWRSKKGLSNSEMDLNALNDVINKMNNLRNKILLIVISNENFIIRIRKTELWPKSRLFIKNEY